MLYNFKNKFSNFYCFLYTIIFTLLTSSCLITNEDDQSSLIVKRANFSEFRNWEVQDFNLFEKSFKKSCDSLTRSSKNTNNIFGDCNNAMLDICQKLKFKKIEREFLESNFSPYLITDLGEEKGLFTAYYEATINGSYKKTEVYKYPVYKLPDNKSYLNFTREEISLGALEGKNLELLWTDDPIKLFFMHIQGSGKVVMDNGKTFSIKYAGKNNHEYTSIGKYLIQNNIYTSENISAPAIKAWLKYNPKYSAMLMNKNKSFIFFEAGEGGKRYPKGSAGVELTPLASIAIDKTKIPYHMPLWIESSYPNGDYLNKLMVSQDTGSAIKGWVRADIFMGRGKRAEILSGHMKQVGKYFILIPRQIDPYTCF